MKILSIPVLSAASADRLRSMIDTADEHLPMLRRFNIDIDQWSSIACVILLGKLDAVTRNQWEIKVDLPEMPDALALFTFLEQRILAIRNVEQSSQQVKAVVVSSDDKAKQGKPQNSNGSRYHPYNRDNRKPSDQANGQPKNDAGSKQNQRSQPPACIVCGHDVHHFLWRCDDFKKLSLQRKEEELAKAGVCKI